MYQPATTTIVDAQVIEVEAPFEQDVLGSMGVVDVPARLDDVDVTALATREARRAPKVWQGLDPTRPVAAEDVPEILAQFETWIMQNVAPRKRQPSPRTVSSYLGDVEQFLMWLSAQELQPLPDEWYGPDALWTLWEGLEADGAEGVPLLLVLPEIVQRFMEFLVAPGHEYGRGSQNPRAEDGSYSPATLAKKRSSLNTFFAFTRKRRLTYGNPLEDMEIVVRTPQDSRSAVEKIKALTRRQAERLLKQVINAEMLADNPDKKASAIRDRVMIDLMMLHGLRNIEVHRLNVADYEPNARGEQGTLRVMGKGDKPRTIILRPEMQAELDLWLNLRAMFKLDDAQIALFISLHAGESWGTRLSQRSIRERVDVYLEAADLKREGVSCHALRHTYATLYVEAKGKDVNREVLAYSMGHGDSKITNAYIDWVDMAAENPSEPLMEILTTAAAEAAAGGAEKKRSQRKR